MALARSLLFTLLLWLWTLVLGVGALVVAFLPRRIAYDYGVLWARGVVWLLRVVVGLRHEVRGRERLPGPPVIYAMKHQSAWETIAMLTIVPWVTGVLKRELLHIPVYGWYLRKIGTVPIDRSAAASALRDMLKQARGFTDQGRSIMIMPEGTRLAPGRRGRYHPGVAALYRHLDLPVVPVALNSGLFWGRRSLVKRPGTITLEFLEPIRPGLDRDAFMALLEDRIETASERLRQEAMAGQPAPEEDEA